MNRIEIYETLKKRYNDSEFKEMCFSLGIDYENLGGATRNDKMLELVMLLERRERLPEIIHILSPQRATPHAQHPAFLQQAKSKIAAGELEEALQIMLNNVSSGSALEKSLLQVSGRFNLYKKSVTAGLLSPADKLLQENTLLANLLEVVDMAD
ncbi:MAG: hypothetical protein JNJ90_17220 [Saprospiraceae bacterium]|jgi:hypothetical protein|nr:hypothetical protein [Saprospiraceae bacterium]